MGNFPETVPVVMVNYSFAGFACNFQKTIIHGLANQSIRIKDTNAHLANKQQFQVAQVVSDLSFQGDYRVKINIFA